MKLFFFLVLRHKKSSKFNLNFEILGARAAHSATSTPKTCQVNTYFF